MVVGAACCRFSWTEVMRHWVLLDELNQAPNVGVPHSHAKRMT